MEPFIIGFLSGLATLFFCYVIGNPGSDFSPHEIFARYTLWLSEHRLKSVQTFDLFQKQYNDNLKNCSTKAQYTTLKNDFKIMTYQAAAPFFTWERAVGMCSVCTGVWMAILTWLIFAPGFVSLIIVILISHITIRIANKIL